MMFDDSEWNVDPIRESFSGWGKPVASAYSGGRFSIKIEEGLLVYITKNFYGNGEFRVLHSEERTCQTLD